MKVVSNSGPLIALARLGRLSLLNQLYDAVLIPPEVYQEVVVNGLRLGAPDADAVQFLIQQEHIQVAPVNLAVDDSLMVLGIDVGEAEIKHQPALWISERLCDEALAQVRRESMRS